MSTRFESLTFKLQKVCTVKLCKHYKIQLYIQGQWACTYLQALPGKNTAGSTYVESLTAKN